MQDEALYKSVVHCFFEDPALEAHPWHEIAVGVGRNEPVAHDTVGRSAHFNGVHGFEDPVGATAFIPYYGGMAPIRYGIYCIALLCCSMQSLCDGGS